MGAVLGGATTLVLVAAGGQFSPANLIVAFLLGTLLSAIAIVAVAGPVWLILHLSGKRGPSSAVLTGAFLAFLLLLAGQTWGFGLAAMPPIDGRTLLYRWASAAAVSLLAAGIGATIGWAMWRVAYRKDR